MPSRATSRFRDQVRNARKIIVVDLGFLGDSIQLIPILCELRRHHPSAELHTLSSSLGAEALNLVPCVSRAWSIEMDPARRTLREQIRVLRSLRQERFEVAFNFSGADRPLFWTWFIGAPHRATHEWDQRHFWTSWLVPYVVAPRHPQMPVAVQRQKVLQALGYETGPLCYELDAGAEASQWAAEHVPQGALHLSINAAKALKEWPLEHSTTLAKEILSGGPGTHIVASGSSTQRERKRLQQLSAQVNSTRLRILPETLTIRQLVATLQRCSLHIGPDSGVMNLAVAVGIPTISFFRAQPGYLAWLPVGEKHHAFVAPCHCIDHQDAPCASAGRAECLASIHPEQVLAMALERLRRSKATEG